jgi:chitin disaccharide deacetylase
MGNDARRLILHCDDLGLSQGINEAACQAFEAGHITSGSVMAVCRRFDEIARYGRSRPDLDLGVHLTLTCEWRRNRWGTCAPPERVPSLLDADGSMWPDVESLIAHAKPDEVALELVSQVKAVIGAGLAPTHLDTHMLALIRSRELFAIYRKLGVRFSLPILVPLRPGADLRQIRRDRQQMPVDCYFAAEQAWQPRQWMTHYLDCLDGLVPGVNQLAVHLGRHGDELGPVLSCEPEENGHGWDEHWRQRDLDVIGSQTFRGEIHTRNISLTTWRALSRVTDSCP